MDEVKNLLADYFNQSAGNLFFNQSNEKFPPTQFGAAFSTGVLYYLENCRLSSFNSGVGCGNKLPSTCT